MILALEPLISTGRMSFRMYCMCAVFHVLMHPLPVLRHAQDAKRGTDLPAAQMADMANAFQRGGKGSGEGKSGGKKRKADG